MRRLLLLLISIMSLHSIADNVSTGEYVDFMVGIPTQDHFFVRGSYDDMGDLVSYDNVISFKSGDTQLVWFHLNDDEIYLNEDVQSLTPQAYNAAGDLYNEITYNGFQFEIYVPQSIEVIILEDPDTGDEIYYEQGDRLPSTSTLSWKKHEMTKEIDGKTYDGYGFACMNNNAFGTHLSAKNPTLYKKNGALKTDATLFGVYLKYKNQDQMEGRIEDMIIGNMMLVLREYKEMFFYGTGGMGVENRFMKYNRVHLYGANGIDGEEGGDTQVGDVDEDGNVSIADVTALIDYLLSGNAATINIGNADCDHDGSVSISDVTALIDYLLSGHWPGE